MGDHRGLRLGWWHCAVLTAVAAVLAAGALAISLAGPASAQREDPSPQELWEAYPLDPEGTQSEAPGTTGPRETPRPQATPTARPSVAQVPAADEDGGLPIEALLAAVLAAFGGGLVAGQIRKHRIAAAAARAAPPPVTPGPRPGAAMARLLAPAPPRPPAAPGDRRAAAAPKPAAPEPSTPSFLDIEALPPESAELEIVASDPVEPAELALPEPEPAAPPPQRPRGRQPRSRGNGGAAKQRRTRRRAGSTAPPPSKPKPPARDLGADVVAALNLDAPEVEPRELAPIDPEALYLDSPEAESRQAEPVDPEALSLDSPEAESRQVEPVDPEASTLPASEAPEEPRVEDTAPALKSRRFERPAPWPDADEMWTCEIAWKPGYVKSCFRAMAAPPGSKRRRPIGESSSLRWTLMQDPEPPTPELVEAVQELTEALKAAGWDRTDAEGPWYALRFLWRGEGLPQRVEIPDRKALKGTGAKDG